MVYTLVKQSKTKMMLHLLKSYEDAKAEKLQLKLLQKKQMMLLNKHQLTTLTL